jgi:ergothioneine biosynthesis protein EgtB
MTQTQRPNQTQADGGAINPVRTPSGATRQQLQAAYERIRRFSETLCEPLTPEDHVIQTATEVSPAKWHLAHMSWFFERFIVHSFVPDYEPYHPQYYYLFNSYYNAVGPQHCRAERGLVSRPTVQEVHQYRQYVDRQMHQLIETSDDEQLARLQPLVTLGLNHEQQHQELLLTDIKHIFSSNPLMPAYLPQERQQHPAPPPAKWVGFEEGVYEVGLAPETEQFCFDNETPRHRVFLEPFEIASRPVTNGEFMRFIEDGGYQRHDLWLSEAWATVYEQGWQHPIYWYQDPDRDHQWMHYTLAGPVPIDEAEPVCHLSLYEADAFARWAGARLPSEFEWEIAARAHPLEGHFADAGRYHPMPIEEGEADGQPIRLFGDVWEWTGSQYRPYPGYQPLAGALGEYNGKFMCNQFVLRGGACSTSQSHLRLTYRNFFGPGDRWQFTGMRLARSV